MKKLDLFFCLLFMLMISACNEGGKKDGLRPSAGTNEAAAANLNLGIAYMQQGDYERALEKLDRAKAADPNFSGVYNAYGLLYQLIERNRDAEKNFKKALKLNPSDSSTKNNYGRFLCHIGRSKQAEEVLLEAADNPLYATPEIAITNAGICAYQNKQLAVAEKHLRRALQMNEQNPPALLHMSQISYDQEKYLSSRAYLQRYLEVSKHTAASLWMGIRIERQLGDKDAIASYSLSLKNNFPDSSEAAMLEAGDR